LTFEDSGDPALPQPRVRRYARSDDVRSNGSLRAPISVQFSSASFTGGGSATGVTLIVPSFKMSICALTPASFAAVKARATLNGGHVGNARRRHNNVQNPHRASGQLRFSNCIK
jgi:hypothetical protein